FSSIEPDAVLRGAARAAGPHLPEVLSFLAGLDRAILCRASDAVRSRSDSDGASARSGPGGSAQRVRRDLARTRCASMQSGSLVSNPTVSAFRSMKGLHKRRRG